MATDKRARRAAGRAGTPKTRRAAARGLPKSEALARTVARASKAERARAAHARKMIAGIRRLMGRVVRDSYRIGEQLTKLKDRALYRSLGYATFADMLDGERLMSDSTARKLMSVARHYSAQQLDDMGVDKAYAHIAYVNATPEDDVAALLVDADAHVGDKPISESSVRDIKARVAELKTAQPKQSRATATRVAHAVERALEHRGASDYRVTPRIADGRWVIDIRLTLDEALLIAK
jgi:hypothetical protein